MRHFTIARPQRKSLILAFALMALVAGLLAVAWAWLGDKPTTAFQEPHAFRGEPSDQPARGPRPAPGQSGDLEGRPTPPSFVVVRDGEGIPVPGVPVVLGHDGGPLPRRIWEGKTGPDGTIPRKDVEPFFSDRDANLAVGLDLLTRRPLFEHLGSRLPENPITFVLPAHGQIVVSPGAALASDSLLGLLRLSVGVDWSRLGERPTSPSFRVVSTFRPWTGTPWTIWVEPELPLRATLLLDGAHMTEKLPGPSVDQVSEHVLSPPWKVLVAHLTGLPEESSLQGTLQVEMSGGAGHGPPQPFHPTRSGRMALALGGALGTGNHRLFLFSLHPSWNEDQDLGSAVVSHGGTIPEGVTDLGEVPVAPLPVLLSGRVENESHDPVSGAKVMRLGRGLTGSPEGAGLLALSDPSGRYVIRGQRGSLGTGLLITRDGYVPEVMKDVREGGRDLLTILRAGGEIRGRIEAPGALPDTVTVELRSAKGLVASTRLRANMFVFTGLEASVHALRILIAGHEAARIDDILVPSGGPALDARLDPVRLEAVTAVEFRITTADGQPLEKRPVRITSADGVEEVVRGLTDERGRVVAVIAHPRPYVWVQADGFQRRKVTLINGLANVTLSPLLSITLEVANPERIPSRPAILYVDLRQREATGHVRRPIEGASTPLRLPGPGVYELRVLAGSTGLGQTPREIPALTRTLTIAPTDQTLSITLPD